MTLASRTLLVVDDERLFADALRDGLASSELDVLVAGTGARALEICRERAVDVVLLDQKLPDAAGSDLCAPILEANERTKIIFHTAFPNFDNVLAALRAGAFDYLTKPCGLEAVRVTLRRCLRMLDLERTASLTRYRAAIAAESSVLVGIDGGLAGLRPLLRVAAGSDSAVLLTGETGTGKSLVANAIHFGSARREKELVSINCAALPESLIEAELFGYEKGSFTGAAGSREGLLEMAEGGTLFLDEIGEMAVTLQTRFLNVLEEKSFRRVGGRGVRRVDFRLVSATNADIEEAIAARRFREDLYYRLNVIRIHLPPLRERREDIPALAGRFLSEIGGTTARAELPPGEIERLQAYDWPGNLRELRNVLEAAWLLREDTTLAPSALLARRLRPRAGAPRATPSVGAGERILPLEEVERRHIEAAVEAAGGNLTRAASMLGVSVSTLRRRAAEAKSAAPAQSDRSI